MKRNGLPVMTGSVPGAKNSSPARFLRRWLTGNATRMPRLAGGNKGRNEQISSVPGSPAPWTGSFTMPRVRYLFLILAPLLFFGACGGVGGDNNAVTPPTPATVIKKANLTLAQDVPAPTTPAALSGGSDCEACGIANAT